MKHAYNTRKRKMWESKIRIYCLGISSHMCHPVTKPSSSSYLESLLTFFYSHLYVFLHIVFSWIFNDIFIFEWRQNLMNVIWNIIISTLIMLWAGHVSQGVTLTTLLIYCQGEEWVDRHQLAPYAFILCTEITLPPHVSFFKLSEESSNYLCIIHVCTSILSLV
jgi:hypothetical protein